MRFLPLFLDTAAGVFILVGSGEPALGKLRLLRAAGAHVRWFSCGTDMTEELLTLPGRGRLEIGGDPLETDLSDVVAAVSAAGDPIDAQIAQRAQAQRIPVNVVDRPELSTFIFPAIVDRGEVVVAIGTGGASPVLARRLRELIEALLPARVGELAELIGRHRGRFAAIPRAISPRRFWQASSPVRLPKLSSPAVPRRRRRSLRPRSTPRRPPRRRPQQDRDRISRRRRPRRSRSLTLRALHALSDADICSTTSW